jgi:Golgi phosphoprotein 3
MAKHEELFLHEEIMLLALRDEAGTIASGTLYNFGLGGAILAELLLGERIRVVTPKKTPLVEPVRSEALGDPVLDECLTMIRKAKKRASLQTWVSRFVGIKKLRHRIAERLAARRILRVDTGKVLGIFSRKIYPEMDPGPEKRIVARLRRAIFQGAANVDPRTVTLVSLAHHTGLLKIVFEKNRLKAQKARIEKIMNGDLTGKAAKQAIEAMQAAVMVACVMPALFVTTTVLH